MGAWGEEPKDNDSVCDLWGYCCDAINAVVRVRWGGDTQARFERAGLIQLLLEKGVHVRYLLVVQAVADLRETLADEQWLAGWKSPKSAAKTITRIADAMEMILTKTDKAKVVKMHSRKAVEAARLRQREVLAWNGWPGPEKGNWTGAGAKRVRKKRRKAKR
jgi:hypothetical protein